MAAKRKQSEVKIAKRQEQAAQLFLKGVPQNKIALELNVSAVTICGDIKAVVAQWKTQSIKDIDSAKAVEIEKCIAVEAAAWEGYEASKKMVGNLRAAKGDPAYLNVILGAISLRCKLLGIDQPPKSATHNSIHFHTGGIMNREKMREEVTRRLEGWKSLAVDSAVTIPGRSTSQPIPEEPSE